MKKKKRVWEMQVKIIHFIFLIFNLNLIIDDDEDEENKKE
jgi:hypothetical protein